MAKSSPFSIRLEEDLKALAEKVAKEENRSLNNLIETAVRQYLSGRAKRK